jgi:protein O-mannosyl-transferase
MAKKNIKNKQVESTEVKEPVVANEGTPSSENSFMKEHWWKVLVLIVMSFIIYFKTVSYDYVLDDLIVIQENKFTKKGFGGIYELFTTESMTGYFGEQKNLVQGNRYRPLSLVSFAIEYGIFNKLKPGVSHFINILLYALCCIIIMRCIQIIIPLKNKIFGLFDLGFVAALFYLAHPLHVEAVANIKGRDEIMAMLFSMAALYYLYRYFVYEASKSNLYLGLLAYFLGLLSKENTITFFAIIPMSIYFFANKKSGKWFLSMMYIGVITLIYLMIRVGAAGAPQFGKESEDIMNNPFLGMTGGEKMATILYSLWVYIKLLFIPYPLTHDYYPYAIPKMHWTDWQVYLSLAIYGGLTYLGFKGLKNKSIPAFSILFYLFTLSIVSNIVINLGTFMNDRFIFMSSLGFCLLVIWAIYEYGDRIKFLNTDVSKSMLSVIVISVFSILSIIRVPDWATALSLNESAMRISGNSARANSFMATALFNEYKATNDVKKKTELMDRAMPYAEKAIEILPDYNNANLMLAGVAAEKFNLNHDFTAFFNTYYKVILNRPDVPYITEYLTYLNPQLVGDRKAINFYINTTKALMKKNDLKSFSWAIHYLKLGLSIDPNNKAMHQALGESYNAIGDAKNATTELNIAASLQ